MNNLQIFSNSEFGEIRTEVKDGQPLFVAVDICRVLGLEQISRAMDRLDEEDRGLVKVTHPQSPSKTIDVNAVTESGLYELVLCSNKPEAKTFKRWITHDVIPTIRKTGGYVNNDEMFINTYLPFADAQTKLMFRSTLETVKALNCKIEADKPKVLFADAVSASHTSILVGDLAKILKQNGVEMGAMRLFSWLRDNGYLIKFGGSKNMPTQRAMEQGLFEIKEGSYIDSNGNNITTKSSRVTGKGSLYFINKFLATQEAT